MEVDSSINVSPQDRDHLSSYRKADKLPQFFASVAATLGSFAMGTVLGYTSPVLPQLQESTSIIPVSKTQGDWIGSLMPLGAIAGALIGGFLMDKLGRRGLLIFLSLPFCFGWLVLTYAQNVAMLYAGRVITGMCTGCVALVVPMYIGEIAHSSIRGMLGTLIQINVGAGILFVYSVGIPLTWQWLSFICGCVPATMAFLLLFVPETPSYLLAKGRPHEAKAALKWLRGERYDIDEEMETVIAAVQSSLTQQVSLRDLRTPVIWKPLVASLGLMVLQQFSGINNIIFYTQNIFKESGSTLAPTTCSMIVGCCQLGSTLISLFLVDSWGRKKLLILSDFVMMIALAALGAFFYIKSSKGDASNLHVLPLVSVLLFVIAFAVGFGPLPWMMMGELFSPKVRELAGAIATCVNWGCAFIVTNTFSRMQVLMGLYGTFWLYSAICALGTVFVGVAVPETKGKSLQEITESFRGARYQALIEEEHPPNSERDSGLNVST